jgi:hypothetical protein
VSRSARSGGNISLDHQFSDAVRYQHPTTRQRDLNAGTILRVKTARVALSRPKTLVWYWALDLFRDRLLNRGQQAVAGVVHENVDATEAVDRS